jgi:hypothetical protein
MKLFRVMAPVERGSSNQILTSPAAPFANLVARTAFHVLHPYIGHSRVLLCSISAPFLVFGICIDFFLLYFPLSLNGSDDLFRAHFILALLLQ